MSFLYNHDFNSRKIHLLISIAEIYIKTGDKLNACYLCNDLLLCILGSCQHELSIGFQKHSKINLLQSEKIILLSQVLKIMSSLLTKKNNKIKGLILIPDELLMESLNLNPPSFGIIYTWMKANYSSYNNKNINFLNYTKTFFSEYAMHLPIAWNSLVNELEYTFGTELNLSRLVDMR